MVVNPSLNLFISKMGIISIVYLLVEITGDKTGRWIAQYVAHRKCSVKGSYY